MNRQSETIREITFAEQDSLILVPPKMLEQVISCCQKGPTSRFALDEFYPPDLMKYLRQVLETNRHLPLFSPALCILLPTHPAVFQTVPVKAYPGWMKSLCSQ